MSHTRSPSQHRPYGLARICHEWQLARSTLYARRQREQASVQSQKRGPKTRYSDEQLTQAIRKVLKNSPWNGEGHRKVWARLRQADIHAGKPRILRLMREAQLLAPQRIRSPKGPTAHEGTIITQSPDRLWGTDATSAWTRQDGSVTIFIAVDHCTAECVGIHAAKPGTRFEALEPIRQGVRYALKDFKQGIATGLSLRHDHGSQYMSHAFQQELEFLGIESSPSFVRAPEGNGVAERFIRTLKEQLLWIEPFETVEDLRLALQQWRKQYNAQWLVQRHGHRTPEQVRRALVDLGVAA